MRGRILASLDQQTDARAALTLARQELKATAAIPEAERPGLLANVAWRELETLSVYCQRKFPLPKRLSEAEFLAYARGYYECAGPARQLFCEVLAGKSEQIRSEALQTYQGFLENPLELARHLPPPSREVKKQEQRRYYEREMKALIENTVRSHTEEFRNLEICGAQKIF